MARYRFERMIDEYATNTLTMKAVVHSTKKKSSDAKKTRDRSDPRVTWEVLRSTVLTGAPISTLAERVGVPTSRGSVTTLLEDIGRLFHEQLEEILATCEPRWRILIQEARKSASGLDLSSEGNDMLQFYGHVACLCHLLTEWVETAATANLEKDIFQNALNILRDQIGCPLVPLIYGTAKSRFTFKEEARERRIPIQVDFEDSEWPHRAFGGFKLSVLSKPVDLYHVMVLVFGWHEMFEKLVGNGTVWNGMLFRYRSNTGILHQDENARAACRIRLELTSYVAMLGSNYGLLHERRQMDPNWGIDAFFARDKREAMIRYLERYARMEDYVRLIPTSRRGERVVEEHVSELKDLIHQLGQHNAWDHNIHDHKDRSVARQIRELIREEKENPRLDQDRGVLANPLSVNVVIFDSQHDKIILQQRGGDVGHGKVPLQISAAGFVSKYIDYNDNAFRNKVNIEEAALNECFQETGNSFGDFECYGIWRDTVNYEVGIALSAERRNLGVTDADGKPVVDRAQIDPYEGGSASAPRKESVHYYGKNMVLPNQEAGVEVAGYYFIERDIDTLFHFLHQTAAKYGRTNIWDCMMPLGAAALISWLAAEFTWDQVISSYQQAHDRQEGKVSP